MADYIADQSTVDTSAAQLVGREAMSYAATVNDSIAAGATLKFGQAFQRKAGAGIALTLSDLALINATQSLRVAMYQTNASDLDNAQYSQYDQVKGGKSGYYVVDVEETVTEADTVRVRLVTNGSDAAKTPGRFCKTADEDKTAVIEGARWVSTGTPFATTNVVFLPDSIKLVLDNLT